jgi:histidinol-phosphate phosphatase family protein
MQAVIMAGGKGTRLSSITNDEIPKPMVKLNGKPILEHQLLGLRENGISEYFFIVGHLGEKIQEYFGDGSKWNVKITYIYEDKPLGTAGALYYLKGKVEGDFFLVFGDLIFDISVARFAEFHRAHEAKITLLVHPNSHPYDSDLIVLDNSSRVLRCDSKNNTRDYYYKNLVNAGLYMLHASVLDAFAEPVKRDLEKDVIFPMIEQGDEVYGYCTSEFVKDVGTPERLRATECDLTNGIVHARNLNNPQKAIFLDRDGTINQYVGLVSNPEQLQLEESAAEAIAMINRSAYLAIVITNQPVVARGMCDIETVEEIHRKMETLLGKEGAYLDAIRYCPHHPDKGYPEENPAYKIPCECRKPKPGMILECAKQFHIDLAQSWMIGDCTMDIQTAINAGTHSILVKTGEGGADGKYDARPDAVALDLRAAVEYILQGGNQP